MSTNIIRFFSQKLIVEISTPVEYSTGVEISTMNFSEKSLMIFVDIYNQYLVIILRTHENVLKMNWVIFYDLSVIK